MAWIKMLETFLPQWEKRAPSELIEAWAEQWGTGDALEKLIHAAFFHDTMEGFLTALDLGEEQDIRRATGRDYTTDAVQLMTLHGAKGLEFPWYFWQGSTVAPYLWSEPARPPNTKEERRLLFVGITRAKESLTLTVGEGSSPFSGRNSPPPSAWKQSKFLLRRKKNPHCFKSIPAYHHIHRINGCFPRR